MLRICIFLCVLISAVICQTTWGDRACLVNPLEYYTKVMQETVSELENEVKWSNFKLSNVSTPVDIELYDWHLVGRVNYTNGFLVSIEKINLDKFIAYIDSMNVSGEQNTMATFRGNLNLNQAKVGFDVDIDFEGHEKKRTTGVFVYSFISWTYTLSRNLNTNAFTLDIVGSGSGGESKRMVFLPANNLTEVASRMYFAYSSGDSFDRWGRDIQQVILQKAQKIDFPEIRFDNNC